MTVSVIIPCFNQAQFLGEAVESCLSQSVPPGEVIVVDDGSSDHTRYVATAYPEVRYLHHENLGLCKARNNGFNASKGKYVIFLDSDDRLAPGMIEQALTALRQSPDAAFSYGRMRRIAVDGGEVAVHSESNREEYFRDLLTDNYIPTPGMALFRRSTLDVHGLFDPTYPATADYDLYLRIVRLQTIVFFPSVAVERRLHTAAMTSNATNMLVSVLKVHERQARHAQADPLLLQAYRDGRKFWRSWYGRQVAIHARLSRMEGHILDWIRATWTLLRYAPFEVAGAWEKARQSNIVCFRLGTKRQAGKADIDILDIGEQKHEGAPEITALESRFVETTAAAGAKPISGPALSLRCRNVEIGMKTRLDGMATPAIVVNSGHVIVYPAADRLAWISTAHY